MIWQFNDRYAEPEYWLDEKQFDGRLKSKEFARMASELGMRRLDCERRYPDAITFDREYIRFGFRDIARDTDERTLIAAMLPINCGVGNKINVCIPKNYAMDESGTLKTLSVSKLRMLFALAVFNSIPMDWVIRFMIQKTVNKTYLFRVPIPQPSDEEIFENADYKTLAKNALLLTLANDWDSFEELGHLFSIKKADLPGTPKAYDQLRHAIDIIVARLYGISQNDLRYILQSFPVMASKRPEYVALFGR